MSISVLVQDLWKEYRIGGLEKGDDTLYDAVSSFFRSPLRALKQRARRAIGDGRFWALRQVEFEVEKGEVLGIIGKNGAGKSTLLKILSRITAPTRGRVGIRGRLASLLEVGTGFHPELTGRENIYLNGAILGMARREITTKFDEIVAFAEVEKFLDTPVKRYSSGMYVRLAFAVAAHLDPDILVVDEVLSVGDAAFQKKSLAKMGEVRGEGRTVLFVSHNMMAVQALCSRAIWLDQGRIVSSARATDVVAAYLSAGVSQESERLWPSMETAPGNEAVRVRYMCARPVDQGPDGRIDLDSPIELVFEYWNQVPGALLNLSLRLLDEQGHTAFSTVPSREPKWNGKEFPRGLFRSTCTIPARLLNSGPYSVDLMVVRNQAEVIYRDENALAFTVNNVPEAGSAWHGRPLGAVRPLLPWSTELLEENA